MALWSEASASRLGLPGEADGDFAGASTALSADGSVGLVGAFGVDAAAADSGGVILLQRNGAGWASQRLAPANGASGDRFGHATALAGDGSLAVVSAPFAARGGEGAAGAVYFYTRAQDGGWSESELVAPAALGANALFGIALAASTDGSAVLVGAGGEGAGRGAAYLYTRNGPGWTALRIAASDGADGDRFAFGGVAISRDAGTLVVGASRADVSSGGQIVNDAGAVYVYRRDTAGTYQETRLVASAPFLRDMLGQSVAVSADGTMIVAGAPGSASGRGRAMSFRWDGIAWTAAQIVPPQRFQNANMGLRVALSADGMLAAVAAPGEPVNDTYFIGAVHLFRWMGGSWQATARIIAPGGAANDFFGSGLAFSADGTELLIGGQGHGLGDTGAAYVAIARRATPGDADNDGDADLLWTGPGNGVALWRLQGTSLVAQNTLSASAAGTGYTIQATGDFDGDGRTDILWRYGPNGVMSMTLLGSTNGQPSVRAANLAWGLRMDAGWRVAAALDFGQDGRADLLWRNSTTGAVQLWTMGAQSRLDMQGVAAPGLEWALMGAGDVDGDGRADLLWRHQDGRFAVWLMEGAQQVGGAVLDRVGAEWALAAIADFDGDKHVDLLWRRESDGQLAMWRLDGLAAPDGAMIESASPDWRIAGAADTNADGRADILWRNANDGRVAVWTMDGPTRIGGAVIGTADPAWAIAPVGLPLPV